MTHGTLVAYDTYGCRCCACREAHTVQLVLMTAHNRAAVAPPPADSWWTHAQRDGLTQQAEARVEVSPR